MSLKTGDAVANAHHDGIVLAVGVQIIRKSRIRNDGVTVRFDNDAKRTVLPETLRKRIVRECCVECMWLGPVNADGTMRRHHPAREGSVSGERKIQDFTKPRCPGSNKPFARFH